MDVGAVQRANRLWWRSRSRFDDEALAAADDGDHAVGADAARVASAIPAVAGELGGGGLWVVE